MATMHLEIITAEKHVLSQEANFLSAPGWVGQLGILPNHAPLVSSLKAGELVIRSEEGEESLVLTGGFIEILSNKVTILADACERTEDINEERAQEAIERAKERIQNRDATTDLERALNALQRAEVRVTIAKRRKYKPGSPGISSHP